MKNIVQKYDKVISFFLVVIVFTMLLMSVINVSLRWFGISYSWIEPMVRHLVFLTAFLGATLASAKSKHIGIEIVGKFLETKKDTKKLFVLGKIVNVITMIALTFLAQSGYKLFIVEKEYGTESFLSIHSSFLVMIIPFGFSLILIRTFLDFLDFTDRGETK